MCFHAPLRPRKVDKFPFLRTRCEITKKKKRENGNPTINYFIYEFHSNRNTCPTETEFVTCYPIILPSRQRFHSAKKMIHSDQHESPTTLPEFMLYIGKRFTSLLLWYNPLPAEPPFFSVHRDKM